MNISLLLKMNGKVNGTVSKHSIIRVNMNCMQMETIFILKRALYHKKKHEIIIYMHSVCIIGKNSNLITGFLLINKSLPA